MLSCQILGWKRYEALVTGVQSVVLISNCNMRPHTVIALSLAPPAKGLSIVFSAGTVNTTKETFHLTHVYIPYRTIGVQMFTNNNWSIKLSCLTIIINAVKISQSTIFIFRHINRCNCHIYAKK